MQLVLNVVSEAMIDFLCCTNLRSFTIATWNKIKIKFSKNEKQFSEFENNLLMVVGDLSIGGIKVKTVGKMMRAEESDQTNCECLC